MSRTWLCYDNTLGEERKGLWRGGTTPLGTAPLAGKKKLSGKQSGQHAWLQHCFRTSWLKSKIRASLLVSTCRMLLKCSKSHHYLLHFLAVPLSSQVSQLLTRAAWKPPCLEESWRGESSQIISIPMSFAQHIHESKMSTWIFLL